MAEMLLRLNTQIFYFEERQIREMFWLRNIDYNICLFDGASAGELAQLLHNYHHRFDSLVERTVS